MWIAFQRVALLKLVYGGLQFTSVTLLALLLTPTELGKYSIVLFYLSIFMQMSALNMYTPANRLVPNAEADQISSILFNLSISVLFLLLATSSVFVLLIYFFDFLTIDNVEIFFILGAVQVFAVTVENLLIGFERPIRANAISVIRVSWLSIIAFLYVAKVAINVETVLLSMLAFEVVASAAGAFVLKSHWRKECFRIDVKLMKELLSTGVKYSVQAIALISIVGVPRVFLEMHGFESEVGLFYFYVAIIAFIPNLIELTAFSVRMPSFVIRRKKAQDIAEFHEVKRSILFTQVIVVGLSVVVLVLLIAVLNVSLGLVGLEEYETSLQVLVLVGLYSLFFVLAKGRFNLLYVFEKDQVAVTVYVVCGVLSAPLGYVLILYNGLEGAALTLCLTSALLFALSSLACKFQAFHSHD